MTNIVYSDWYRLRRGAAARNTVIGLAATVVFLVISLSVMTSQGMQLFLDEMEGTGMVSETEMAQVAGEMEEFALQIPQNAADFGLEVLSYNMLPFFALPFIITIFCADFSAGTYRNTLSYHNNRTGIYLSKLFLCLCSTLALNVLTLGFSWLFGGIAKGFAGFGAAYLGHVLVAMLLLFVGQLGVICFGFCLVAVSRKSSTTIAAYILTLVLISVPLQLLSLLPSLGWLTLLDWNSIGSVLIHYPTATAAQLLITLGSSVVIAVASTAVGIVCYNRADMA